MDAGGICHHLFDYAFGSIFMGLLANLLPVALAPAMGLNAFFAFVVVGAMGISGRWAWAPSSGARSACCC